MGNVDAVLYLEVDATLYLMNRWDINKKEFLDLNKRYGIIKI